MTEIRALREEDIRDAIELWSAIPELRFSKAFDTEERLFRFLRRNPGLSSAASLDGKLVGALLCGHDGRRGFFYHAGVIQAHRRQGIAGRMAELSFRMLRDEQIDSCFLFTNDFNTDAQRFWKSVGFEYAPHVMYHSRAI
jgi:ribosomal protein S18 acetylase RimI-like enzyme